MKIEHSYYVNRPYRSRFEIKPLQLHSTAAILFENLTNASILSTVVLLFKRTPQFITLADSVRTCCLAISFLVNFCLFNVK